MHGLYRSLVNNMVVGVSKGYEIKLERVGVGYRAKLMPGTCLTLHWDLHTIRIFNFLRK